MKTATITYLNLRKPYEKGPVEEFINGKDSFFIGQYRKISYFADQIKKSLLNKLKIQEKEKGPATFITNYKKILGSTQ